MTLSSSTASVPHRVVDIEELCECKVGLVAMNDEQFQRFGRVGVSTSVRGEEEIILQPSDERGVIILKLWRRGDLGFGDAFGGVLNELTLLCADDHLLALARPARSGERTREWRRGSQFLYVYNDETFACEENDISPQWVRSWRCWVRDDINERVWNARGD